MLWLARLALRSRVGVVRVGHGYADPNFRPPSLPFASLVGPLSIDVEPERDLPVASDVLVQLPGVLRGETRAGETVPVGATLDLVLDEDAHVQLVLSGGNFASPAAARALCQDVESRLRDAVAAQTIVDGAGAVIVDAERFSSCLFSLPAKPRPHRHCPPPP